jgi:hypothetical protein
MSERQATTNITPIGYGIALTTSSIQVIAANITRRGLMFHNRSQTLYLYVAPQPIVAGAAGSLLIVPAGYSPLFSGGSLATCAWNGAMVTSTGDVTILEWP